MNIILIISDTFRWDYLGCYGNNWISTPNLDRFARRSVIFDKAYAASFPTVPHRMDLVTGRFTFTYRQWEPLPKDEVALAEILGENGYTTMLITDTPHILEDGYNFDRGFTGWEWIRGQETDRYMTDPVEVKLPCAPHKLRTPEIVKRHLRNISQRRGEEDCFVAQTMLTAAKWLQRNYENEKFFLWVDTFDPHEPWDAPKWYVEGYDPGYEGEEVIYPVYGKCDYLTEAELKHIRALYAAEVTLVDRWVGMLLQKIEDLDLFDNTAVIFTSDHGFYLGEHNLVGKSIISENLFQYVPLYEELARIPLFIWLPESKRSFRCSSFVQPPDLTATTLDIAGLKRHERIQGKSLLPIIEGKDSLLRNIAVSSPSLVNGRLGAPRITLRKENWSLILAPSKRREDTKKETRAVDGITRNLVGFELKNSSEEVKSELYDVSKDPRQEKNIFIGNKDKVDELHSDLIEFLIQIRTEEEYLKYWKNTGD
ncbi:MAG: sulfatase [Candidatus Aerophobus sp.]|nr:MAG: sulfatase [Candidatus Aerophobus sp.]